MRELKLIEHVSLDGVMQHTEDENGFPHAGWNVPHRSAEGMGAVLAAHGERFDLVLGRRTYDRWSEVWPTAPGPMAERINAGTKYVATHRPDSLGWGPSASIGPDVVEDVRRIKSDEGPHLVLEGSSTLASLLLSHGLVDELLIITYPVLLGTGKRLFAEGVPALSFVHVDGLPTPTGVVLNTYRPDGPLKTA